MEYTTNYQLNQWDAQDAIKRTDFNADNAKIDAALGAIPKIAAGSYVGNGGSGSTTAQTQTIDVGFHPRAVLVYPQDSIAYVNTGTYGYKYVYSAVATREAEATVNDLTALAITESGFTVNYQRKTAELSTYGTENIPATNYGNKTFHYIAIG